MGRKASESKRRLRGAATNTKLTKPGMLNKIVEGLKQDRRNRESMTKTEIQLEK